MAAQEYIGWITPTYRGMQEVTLPAAVIAGLTREDCLDLRAYQAGQQIPIWVKPGASKAGDTCNALIRTASTDTVFFATAGAEATAWTGTTRAPTTSLRTTAAASITINHPTKTDRNPITDVVHPRLVAFAEAWNGYLYWLALTPLPASQSAYEDPIILASNDKTTWTQIAMVHAAPAGQYNSDVHLHYDQTTDTLVCVWMLQSAPGGTTQREVLISESSDGETWSEPVSALTLQAPAALGMNPAIVPISANLWYMFLGWEDGEALPNAGYHIRRYTSTDRGRTWASPIEIPDILPQEYHGFWHFDVNRDPGTGLFILLGSASRRNNYNGNEGSTWFFAFSDDSGATFTADTFPLGGAASNNWITTNCYRPSLCHRGGTDWTIVWGAVNPLRVAFVDFTHDWATRSMQGLQAVAPSSSDFTDAGGQLNFRLDQTPAYAGGTMTLQVGGGLTTTIYPGDRTGKMYTMECRLRLLSVTTALRIAGTLHWSWDAGSAEKIAVAGNAATYDYARNTDWHVLRLCRLTNTTADIYLDGTKIIDGATVDDAYYREIVLKGTSGTDGIEIDYFWTSRDDIGQPTPVQAPPVTFPDQASVLAGVDRGDGAKGTDHGYTAGVASMSGRAGRRLRRS